MYHFENEKREIIIEQYNTPTPWMNYLSNGTFHPIRGILSFKGYTEGYATYAECLSYDYAKMFADSGYCDASNINRRLHLALYSMLDVCIHYYGYDLNDTRECLIDIFHLQYIFRHNIAPVHF